MKIGLENLKRLAIAAFGIGVALSPAAAAPNDSGAATFATHCEACHAADGSGDTVVGKSANIPDLRAPQVQNQTDDRLQDVIAHGLGTMPAFGTSLSADEIHGLVQYVRGMAKKN
jgi:mono/diheme cytochrome c family protein